MEANDFDLLDEVPVATDAPLSDALLSVVPKVATDLKLILSSFTYEIILHDKLQENEALTKVSSHNEPISGLFKYYLEIDVAIDNTVIHSRKSELGDHLNPSFLFDFISYFGTAKFNFKLIKSEIIPNCIMSSNILSVVGTKSMYLYEFFKGATSHSNVTDSWYQLYEIPFYSNENKSLTKKNSKIQSIVDQSSLNKWYRKLSLNDVDAIRNNNGNNDNNNDSSKEKSSVAYTFYLKFRAGILCFQNVVSPADDCEVRYICLHKLVQDSLACNKEVICDLLSSLSSKNILNKVLEHEVDGNTLLDTAILAGNYVVVRALLKRAGSLCFTPLKRNTKSSLHKAITSGNFNIFSILLSFLRKYYAIIENWRDKYHSFDEIVDWIDERGDSPLLQACGIPKRSQFVHKLIFDGANCAIRNTVNRRTCFMNAASIGEVIYLKQLLVQRVTNIMYPSALPKLCHYKCLPLECDINGDTAMHLAVKYSQLETASYMYTLGMYHPLLNNFNRDNNSLVHLAIKNCSRENIEPSDEVKSMIKLTLQIEKKSYLSYQKKHDKKSVLHTMATYRKVIYAVNNQGESPLSMAKEISTKFHEFLLCTSHDIYGKDTAVDVTDIIIDNEETTSRNDKDNSDDYAFALSPNAKPHAQY